MPTVIKIGGSSLETQEKIEGVIDQINHITQNEDKTICVVSAQGKTTDRIKDAIEGTPLEPEEILQETNALIKAGLFPSTNGIVESAYQALGSIKYKRRINLTESDIAFYHLLGERVSATVFSHVLNERGIRAEFIDFVNDDFPIAVTGSSLNGRVDTQESEKRIHSLSRRNSKILVIPGYGGIDLRSRKLKTLGRGGSDTSAAYIFHLMKGDNLWILTDVYGILEADMSGAKTIETLHVEEAMDAASLGAKLPGRRAVIPLKRYFEHANPNVYISHSQDVKGPKTKIVGGTIYAPSLRLVAGRDATLYEINGNVKGFQSVLDGSGLDWSGYFTDEYARIVVSAETSEYAENLIKEFVLRQNHEGRLMGSHVQCGFVGVVGHDLLRMGATQRVSSVLYEAGVNILYNMDPGLVSIGYIVSIHDLKKSVEALYKKLFLEQ